MDASSTGSVEALSEGDQLNLAQGVCRMAMHVWGTTLTGNRDNQALSQLHTMKDHNSRATLFQSWYSEQQPLKICATRLREAMCHRWRFPLPNIVASGERGGNVMEEQSSITKQHKEGTLALGHIGAHSTFTDVTFQKTPSCYKQSQVHKEMGFLRLVWKISNPPAQSPDVSSIKHLSDEPEHQLRARP